MARLKARLDLFDFALYLDPPDHRFSWHHQLLYRWLQDFAEGRRKRVLIQMPPGHGKSQGVSRNLPAFLLGRSPDARIIACSYTADLAGEMNRDVQRVMDTEEYHSVFPGTRLNSSNVRTVSGAARRNADIFDVVGRRGYYKAAGVGGGIVGRRFDFGIIDDPVKDREAANSPTQREALWRWYTSAFSTRQSRDASICLTLTRWHEDDLAGRLLAKAAKGEGEPWDVLSLPALAGPERHADDPRQPGDALWPWFEDAAKLERRRLLDPRDYAALYQQTPRAEGGTEWPDSYFGPGIWFDEWPKDLTLRTLALDPSKGKDAKWGDYSAIVRLGRCSAGTLWCEADLQRRSTEQIVADCIEHQRVFRADAFAVETNQFQELLAAEMRRVSALQGIMLPIVEYVNTVNKLVRIRRLGPYLAAGNLRFKGDSAGTQLLVQQLRDFPLAAHDDGADAAELALRCAIETHNGRQQARPKRMVAT